jgi:hypothetical protein
MTGLMDPVATQSQLDERPGLAGRRPGKHELNRTA